MSSVLLVACIFVLSSLGGISGDAVDNVIYELAKSIAKSQVVHNETSVWVHQKGMYPGQIRVNFAGFPEAKMLRRSLEVFDNNAFITLWVTVALLEASQLEEGPSISDEQLDLAIQALSSYHDKNLPIGDGIMVFWPQSYNLTSKEWYCNPVNVANTGYGMIGVLNYFHKLMDDMGLEKLWNKTLERTYEILTSSMASIQVPPDFDDTYVNLGLGSLLSKYKLSQQDFFQEWKINNTNPLAVFQALKMYAYRPFSPNLATSLIDPRTYFYIRNFLYSIEDSPYPAAFVTTWAFLITNDTYTMSMPFHVNNIDLAVSANVLYGITTSILNGFIPSPEDWFDEELQIIYENTTTLISYIVGTNFTGRPDLALDYYPSVFNFYWFLSRTLNIMENYSTASPLPFPVLNRVKDMLSKTLRETVTDVLMKKYHKDSEGFIYYEEILGLNDTNISGEKVDSGDDRLCSTAMVVNALVNIWTSNMTFLNDIPEEVKTVIKGAVHWMVKNYKGPAYNVLFSGSVKTEDDLPFYYPYNYVRDINGTVIPIDKEFINNEVTVAIRSFVSEKDYNSMLQERRFGHYTPIDFIGYNTNSAFPYWSSQPFTHAAAVLSLSQYRALVKTGQLPPYDDTMTT